MNQVKDAKGQWTIMIANLGMEVSFIVQKKMKVCIKLQDCVFKH